MFKIAKDNDKEQTEFYVWIDAGVCIFRDKKPPDIKLNLLNINSLPHDKICYSHVEENYHNFAATVLIMHKSIIDKVHEIYYKSLQHLGNTINDFRCGSDQFIHTYMLEKYPTLYYKISNGYAGNLLELYKLTI